ncbi:MAG: SMP-30/gluconolactonase/LRE family protein [Actinomycetota bacterium]|nr:SMP-30/gluconolactonase/LRE family protein [Actinomycetota bacterium]
MVTDEVELAWDAGARIGEGPVWDGPLRTLVWLDIPRGLVHGWHHDDGPREPFAVGQPVGAVAPRASGGLVAAVRDGFAFLQPGSGRVSTIDDTESDRPGNRMNDGKCDPAGRFWAGTMALDERPGAGALYRLDPDLRVERVLDGVTISNGLGWSPDGATMYYIDSPTGGVDAFDYDPDTGAVAGRRRLTDVAGPQGIPDGLTVDAEGCLWVAVFGGGRVQRHAPDGALLDTVTLPVTQVTSCAFGGPDLDELYITSARQGLSEEALRDQPHAGGLFRHRPEGVVGLPVHQFLG